jgi:hypothetical protein
MTCWTVLLTPLCVLAVLFEAGWEKMTISYTAIKNSPDYLIFIYAGRTKMLRHLQNASHNLPKQSWRCDALETGTCWWRFGVWTKTTLLDVDYLYVAQCSHNTSLKMEIHYSCYTP